jgi:hypothetical protein
MNGSSRLSRCVFSNNFEWLYSSRYTFNEPPIQLFFPLKKGIYYVGQGGNSPAINYHNASLAQRYALDIVKLNVFGTRANGFQMQLAQSGTPKESLTNYVIFGEILYSPCV